MLRNLQMKLSLLYSILLALYLVSTWPSHLHAAVVEGVVLSDQGPVIDAKVLAYRSIQDTVDGTPIFTSTTGEKPGFYRIDLPSGSYHLVAVGSQGGVDLFSFHGANPIKVADEKLWLPFTVVPKTKPIATPAETPRLSGTITFKGKPVAEAQVSLYALSEGQFKGMGLLTNTSREDGSFRFTPPTGEYLVVARKRMASHGDMPLKKGDLFCYYGGNPAIVAQKQETTISVPCYPKDDLPSFLEEKAVVKKSRENIARFREKPPENKVDLLRIAGRVSDAAGRPAKGLYINAYKGDPDQSFQMHYLRLMPDYLTRTDENGIYQLDVPDKGKYYLVAREFAGEAPLKGEMYGLFEGNVDHSVTLTASMTGADIMVSRVMADDMGQKDAKGKLAAKAITNNSQSKISVKDAIIDRDTEWAGEVTISGTVLVKRGVTLTVKPGTVVRFVKIDRNGDGIGDGEIRVLGRMIAKGTSSQQIRFTSAESKPGPADWSYLLIFVSGVESNFEHCRFEYAFTGLQVHFSKARVSDSVFCHNREGIRFGRAELSIDHNDITGNTYGIRHTRLEGPVSITANNISNNEVGIFLVPSNQNIVNFMTSPDSPPNIRQNQPLVKGNNIFNNHQYNYKLGERQNVNILVQGNWWGTAIKKNIYGTIFDKNKDKSLGAAIIDPYRTAPIKNTGPRKGGARENG